MTCTTPTTSVPGRTKVSLAHQIDRLDAILDGLAEALNGAVADAVKEAVGAAVAEAVEATLAEVLVNPELLSRLTPVAPPAPPAPTWRDRVAAVVRRVRVAARSAAKWVKRTAIRAVTAVAVAAVAIFARPIRWYDSARTAVAAICLAGAFRRGLAVALVVGVAVGAGCYLAGPVVASAAGGIGGAAVALPAQLFRRESHPWHRNPKAA